MNIGIVSIVICVVDDLFVAYFKVCFVGNKETRNSLSLAS